LSMGIKTSNSTVLLANRLSLTSSISPTSILSKPEQETNSVEKKIKLKE